MHVPALYQADSPTWLWRIVREHPLALLVTNGSDGVPHATHLPIVRSDGGGDGSELNGASLVGHMDRANPHWKALKPHERGKLVFTGPGGYVTPTLYGPGQAAPTWDFVAVHLEGTISLVDDFDATLRIVRLTAATYERRFGSGWQPEGSLDYFRSIVAGVGAFRFEVHVADGMFKLSQEKPPHVRERVRRWFLDQQVGGTRALAQVMGEVGTCDASHRP